MVIPEDFFLLADVLDEAEYQKRLEKQETRQESKPKYREGGADAWRNHVTEIRGDYPKG